MSETRVCTGPAHAVPVRLPIGESYWPYHRSGPKAGEPMARCKSCVNWSKLVKKDGPHGKVDPSELLPLLDELILRCEGVYGVERAHGIAVSTVTNVLDGTYSRMHKRTAQRILAALVKQREHDRRHGVSRAWRDHLTAKAQREGRMDYLLAQDARWFEETWDPSH